jgi:hypothetical protein
MSEDDIFSERLATLSIHTILDKLDNEALDNLCNTVGHKRLLPKREY